MQRHGASHRPTPPASPRIDTLKIYNDAFDRALRARYALADSHRLALLAVVIEVAHRIRHEHSLNATDGGRAGA